MGSSVTMQTVYSCLASAHQHSWTCTQPDYQSSDPEIPLSLRWPVQNGPLQWLHPTSRLAFGDIDFVPNLANEWLMPIELTNCHQAEKSWRSTLDVPTPLTTNSDPRSSDDEGYDPREIPDAPQRAPTCYDTPQRRTTVPNSGDNPFSGASDTSPPPLDTSSMYFQW